MYEESFCKLKKYIDLKNKNFAVRLTRVRGDICRFFVT